MSPSLTQCEAREAQFAAEVDGLARAGDEDARRALLAFCDERHATYAEQPGPAVTRMRGWVLEALCRAGPLPDEALPFVLEELETAHDAYLLAVAAWCLRRYREPLASFSEALALASRNAPGVEAPVMLGVYGGAGPAGVGNTSPTQELAATLEWMGPPGRPVALPRIAGEHRGVVPREGRGPGASRGRARAVGGSSRSGQDVSRALPWAAFHRGVLRFALRQSL